MALTQNAVGIAPRVLRDHSVAGVVSAGRGRLSPGRPSTPNANLPSLPRWTKGRFAVPPLPQPQPEPEPEHDPEPEPDALFKPPKHYRVGVRIKTRTTTKTYHHVVREPIGVYDYSKPTVTYSETFDHPALVPGDVEIFEAEFEYANKPGKKFSHEKGVWTLVKPPHVWHAVLVHKLEHPKGALMVQLMQAFDDPNDPAPWFFAITGGTDNYKGAFGQITYVNDQNITFEFWVPQP